mmetsp:Transcript_19399/g.42151  ORF Transcript_19399/g.42151 Transcript_19399/m.42151 type:complete len:475 (+) Transcript_19399:70-1494(+)
MATQTHESSPLLKGNFNCSISDGGVDLRSQHLQLSGPTHSAISDNATNDHARKEDDLVSTLASVAGNVLEWYDFAIYGYFADIIGQKFFPPTNDESTAIIGSFLVFGGAFLVRPIGGILMGYIGDTVSRKRALEISIFLMALPTFLMGCLPTFETWGWWALVALVFVRILQGLSVGGQLMSSLVFVAEGHDSSSWGWYGSFAMTAANIGTLLGGVCGFGMRHYFTPQQLSDGLWRIPFLCGILVSISGFYLKHHVKDHKKMEVSALGKVDTHQPTPLELAFSKESRPTLYCATAAVFLWAGGFYIVFVWLVICMRDLLEHPVQNAFAINAVSLFITMVLLFPFAGWLSDRHGRKTIMTIGASGMALLSPLAMKLISSGDGPTALVAQSTLGIFLCLYGAPLCAFLVEAFPPESRLTSVAIGYNTALAIAGGLSPTLATLLVREYGPTGAGYLLSTFALISLCGVHMTPKHTYHV